MGDEISKFRAQRLRALTLRPLGQRGMSMVAVLMLSVIAILSSVVLFQSISVSIRAVSNTRIQDESNHFRNIIFNSLNCTSSLSALIDDPSFNADNNCVTELNPSGGLPDATLIPLINRDGGSIFSSYNDETKVGKLGDYDAKAACYKRVRMPSGTVSYCVVIHTAILDSRNAAPGTVGFRRDPRTHQFLEWKSLFSFPLCCDAG